MRTAKKRTLGHEVGTIQAVCGAGVEGAWLIVVLVVTHAGRVTYRHAESFVCEESELDAFMLQMLEEARLCADALEVELMAARMEGRDEVRAILDDLSS